jgi:uncharacterized membrane protein YedE/YeeE
VGVAATAAAFGTGLIVLTAVPVGLLFGFFLQKGDLCGASAMSEVILFRDRGKLFGFWVAIVTSMLVFGALDLAGLVKLNPKPFTWVSAIVGGLVFGAGTVLAGGCVSGSLFKAGAGNLNSMAALAAIPFGVAMVKTGPLAAFGKAMKAHVVKSAEGKSVTVTSMTGLPLWSLGLIVAAATLAYVLLRKRPERPADVEVREGPGLLRRLLYRRWRPWQAGIAIGLLGGLAWLSSASSGRNYPLGVTGGVHQVGVLAIDANVKHVVRPAPKVSPATAPAKKPAPKEQKVVWWLVAVVCGVVAGSLVAAKSTGDAALLPRPPGQTMVAFLGGLLVGSGAALAHGCMIGNVLSGGGMLAAGAIVFAASTLAANWAVTRVYLMGR